MSTTNEETPPQDAGAVVDEETPKEGNDNIIPTQPEGPGPFALEVDPNQQWKAKELKICSFARPHMRAFHVSVINLVPRTRVSIYHPYEQAHIAVFAFSV